MTTDELYEIAQKGKGESITLGWFEDNKPCNEMWHEELCYYEDHTVDSINVFSYCKEDGKFIVKHHYINPSWIRKVNGKSVDMKYMNFKNEWGLAMFNLKEYIGGLKKICKKKYNYNCSSYFDHCWKDVLMKMIQTRDYNKTYSFVLKQGYYNKTWKKLIVDLNVLFAEACKDDELYVHCLGVNGHTKNQLFQFLHNLFLTEDVKNVKISLS
jgi:hypothetical protein